VKPVTLPGSVPLSSTLTIQVVVELPFTGPAQIRLPLEEKEISDFQRLELQVQDLRREVAEIRSTGIVKVSTFSFAQEKLLTTADYSHMGRPTFTPQTSFSFGGGGTEKAVEHVLLSMNVTKKLPNSQLLIQGVLAVHGQGNAESYEWCYGNTIVTPNAEGYQNTSTHARAIPTVIIAGHQQTGPQLLELKCRTRYGGVVLQCGSCIIVFEVV